MEKLELESTLKSPKVLFDNKKGIINIEGRSILEDPASFYEVLFKWIEEYTKNPAEKTNITIKLEYLNSSSSKYLTGLFQLIERIKDSEVFVKWYFEEQDESIEEIGQHIKSNFAMAMDLISYKE